MNEHKSLNDIAQAMLRDNVGGLVLQAIQDAARIKLLENEIQSLKQQILAKDT